MSKTPSELKAMADDVYQIFVTDNFTPENKGKIRELLKELLVYQKELLREYRIMYDGLEFMTGSFFEQGANDMARTTLSTVMKR